MQRIARNPIKVLRELVRQTDRVNEQEVNLHKPPTPNQWMLHRLRMGWLFSEQKKTIQTESTAPWGKATVEKEHSCNELLSIYDGAVSLNQRACKYKKTDRCPSCLESNRDTNGQEHAQPPPKPDRKDAVGPVHDRSRTQCAHAVQIGFAEGQDPIEAVKPMPVGGRDDENHQPN